MAKNPVSGKRTDGGFTITSNNPSVVKGRGDAKLYFGVQKEATTANPTDVGTLYSVTAKILPLEYSYNIGLYNSLALPARSHLPQLLLIPPI